MGRRVAFVPCRAGSQRAPHKNTRPFAGNDDGLLGLKLSQLLNSETIDEILVSSNDPEVLRIGHRISAVAEKPVRVCERPEHLCVQSTSMDDVALHACELIGEATIVWAFVTSPLVEGADYDRMVLAYEAAIAARTHDSLMSVTRMHRFLWSDDGPFNYKREPLKWPRSQDLPTLYDANQACFIISDEVSRNQADRVGKRPLLFEIGAWKSVDVDWEDDFEVAQALYQMRGTQR